MQAVDSPALNAYTLFIKRTLTVKCILLIKPYFLVTNCYKRMRLTTSFYSNTLGLISVSVLHNTTNTSNIYTTMFLCWPKPPSSQQSFGINGRGGYRGRAKGAVAPPLQPRSIGFFNTKMSPSPPPAPFSPVAPQARVFMKLSTKTYQKC